MFIYMTENTVERSSLSAVDIIAYPQPEKRGDNHANLFFKDEMTMSTTKNVPNIGLNNCRNVEVHSQEPDRVIITSSENCIVHVYSDNYNQDIPVIQSNSGELTVDDLNNINCKIVYHPKIDFPTEYASDTCNFLKNGKITTQINAELSGKISTGDGKTQIGKK